MNTQKWTRKNKIEVHKLIKTKLVRVAFIIAFQSKRVYLLYFR
jgi:hypothetical protein